MPRPRTKTRLAADIVSASVASKSGARAPGPLALAISASRAFAVGVGLRCLVPGMGEATLLKRLGTVISIPTIVTRPSTLGFCKSGPETLSAMSAVAETNIVGDDLGVLAGQANGAGKAGGRHQACTSPFAAIEPALGVVPARRSIRIVSPFAINVPVIAVSLNPV